MASVESAGWVSLVTAERIAAICLREGVDAAVVCAHFHVHSIDEMQTEDLFDALVFIGKRSKGE